MMPTKKGRGKKAIVVAGSTSAWLEKAEATALSLLEELAARRSQLKPLELIGAVRALTEAMTTARALAPGSDADDGDDGG